MMIAADKMTILDLKESVNVTVHELTHEYVMKKYVYQDRGSILDLCL